GKEAVEAGMGYSPMVPANPVKREDEAPVYDSGDHAADLRGAADELLRRDQEIRERQGRPVHIERQYLQQAGANAGKPMPENQTVSPEQAAHDLSTARSGDEAINEALENAAVAEAIDQLRADDNVQPQQQPIQQQPQAPVQPEINQQGDFDLASEFQKNP